MSLQNTTTTATTDCTTTTKHPDLFHTDDSCKNNQLPDGVYVDPEDTLKEMDRMCRTNFLTHVRNEKNARWVGLAIERVVSELQVERAAMGIRWITSGWNIQHIAVLIKFATCKKWTCPQIAELTDIVSRDWPMEPHTARLAYHMIEGMTLEGAADFLALMTKEWSPHSALTLLEEISKLYGWNNSMFNRIAVLFTLARATMKMQLLKIE